MNRILLMVLRNLGKVPGLYTKLCRYAKHTDDYPEQEKWDHIKHILELAVKSGNGYRKYPRPRRGLHDLCQPSGSF